MTSFLYLRFSSRAKLKEFWDEGLGSENNKSGNLELYVRYQPDKEIDAEDEQELQALCGRFSLKEYVNAWEKLPPLKPIAAIDVGTDAAEIHKGVQPGPPHA